MTHSLYLTRAVLAPTSRNIERLLRQAAGADQGHSLIWSLFEAQTEGPARFLWRETEAGRRWLLLSPVAPQAAQPDLWSLETEAFRPAFSAGARLRFSLRANPAVTLPGVGERDNGKRKHGKHVDVVMHARHGLDPVARAAWSPADTERVALDWLYAREDRLGLSFERDACLAMSYRQVDIPRGRSAPPIRFSTVDYQGVASVTDPALLANAVASGVGRARRYGCGLLLLRPA